ncbi:MAG: L-seryl-tRNA(Sec) selenium transferase [Clostridia bacterium]|nr:L-seryl-tRNA(Sec) selenium transferase [Clostridia bacterium]
MDKPSQLLRSIPRVDDILSDPLLDKVRAGSPAAVVRAVRETLGDLREDILNGRDPLSGREEILAEVRRRIEAQRKASLRPVINGTGIVLHTNLGRACLSERAARHVYEVARGYSDLEYDLVRGQRGKRYSHVEPLLTELTGAEAAVVVNNNAAAVLLTLTVIASGREVVISRGELVEIGGAFRVPDVMVQSGCALREVGTTNRTRLSDYRAAIGENTAALLKVHTSNYRIVGFTEEAELAEMAALAHDAGLPLLYDLGSGDMAGLDRFGIGEGRTVREGLEKGADIVCFSGDKLLGGPQAGIILGRREYIERIKAHPLIRALRIDKLTLAALESTLLSYREEGLAEKELPVLAALSAGEEDLRRRAQQLADRFSASGIHASPVSVVGQVGGGSAPTELLPSWAVAVDNGAMALNELDARLRTGSPPVVGRIHKNQYLLDVRTIFDADFDALTDAVAAALKK